MSGIAAAEEPLTRKVSVSEQRKSVVYRLLLRRADGREVLGFVFADRGLGAFSACCAICAICSISRFFASVITSSRSDRNVEICQSKSERSSIHYLAKAWMVC